MWSQLHRDVRWLKKLNEVVTDYPVLLSINLDLSFRIGENNDVFVGGSVPISQHTHTKKVNFFAEFISLRSRATKNDRKPLSGIQGCWVYRTARHQIACMSTRTSGFSLWISISSERVRLKREKWTEQSKGSDLLDERVAVTYTSFHLYSTCRYIYHVQMTKPVIVRQMGKCNWQRVRRCIRVTERLSSTLCDCDLSSFLVTVWILFIYLGLP